jgi:hypothetical protein
MMQTAERPTPHCVPNSENRQYLELADLPCETRASDSWLAESNSKESAMLRNRHKV